MNLVSLNGQDGVVSRVTHAFRPRDLFVHDGSTMRRVHVSTKVQVAGAALATSAMMWGMLATVQVGMGAPTVANAIGKVAKSDAAVARMNAKLASMESEMASLRSAAADHAKRLDQRQAFLDAMLTGKGNVPALPASATATSDRLGSVIAPLASVEQRQNQLAGRVAAITEARYRVASAALGRLGLNAGRFQQVRGGMGGPYEPVPAGGAPTAAATDTQFRSLFQSWKRLETLQQGIVAIPSQRPVESMTFTSGFGVRSDPFRGSAAMHAGVDMPGKSGTSIFATADGIVGRTGWAGGYGNLVELDHGRGIQTRYGHLSAILVTPGMRVTRGQLIARMGSTGRSTGTHLHYEVRLDGHAVNPMPFLQSANYLMAMQARTGGTRVALGGPTGE